MVKFKRLIFPLLFSVISFRCANQLPPGGGEVDRIPPEVTAVYPENQTINFSEKYFDIEFSEYVDKRSFKDAIFISPALKYGIETDWSGTSVRVNFLDTLRENTTYTVTIGTDVVDYNNRNRMAEAVVFAFSTGDKIANGTLSGRVYAEKPSGVFLFAYLNPYDSVNISEDKPDYISQAGTEGNYSFTGLNYGKYLVFAVKDEFKDLLFQPEQDQAGIPFTEVNLTAKDTGFTGLNFTLTKIDTTGPRLLSAVMTDIHHILVSLSEPVDLKRLSNANFTIRDTLQDKEFQPDYLFKGRSKDREVVLGLKQLVIPDTGGYILRLRNAADVKGNMTLHDSVSILGNEKPDTTAPGLIRVSPPYNSQDVNYENAEFSFGFDDAVAVNRLTGSVSFTDTSKKPVEFTVTKIDDASFTVKPVIVLKPQSDYLIKMDLSLAEDAAGNFLDSIYVFKFRTKSDLSNTGLYGNLLNLKAGSKVVLVMEHQDKEDVTYSTQPGEDGKFSFTKIEPGKYRMKCFYDRNGNGIQDEGKLHPFQFSEEFIYFKDVINLAPRWAVTDFIFDLEKDGK